MELELEFEIGFEVGRATFFFRSGGGGRGKRESVEPSFSENRQRMVRTRALRYPKPKRRTPWRDAPASPRPGTWLTWPKLGLRRLAQTKMQTARRCFFKGTPRGNHSFRECVYVEREKYKWLQESCKPGSPREGWHSLLTIQRLPNAPCTSLPQTRKLIPCKRRMH